MRLNFRHIILAGTASVVLSVISGCVALIPAEKTVDVSQYSSLTTVDAIKKLESNLKQSAENKLNIYAPDHYLTADKALIDARKLISKNEPRSRVVQKVAVASAVLKNGDIVMRKVKDILEDQLIVKEKLDSLATNKVYRSEYGSLAQRLNNIIREIERGNLKENEQSRSKLLLDMQKLERKSIRYSAMHEPEEILKRVKYRNGEILAPLTYKDALEVFLRAEQFIDQNPNYEVGIDQMGAEALFAAKRALYITEQVASLSQKVNYSLEQVILDEEYRLYRISRELDSADLRDNPLEMQSEELAKIARNLAEEYRNKEGLIIALRDTLIKVRDSSAQLSALSEISRTLKTEKGEWIAKEALYKAKVAHLESNLNQSQSQLDQTQQKLLSVKDENNQLSESLHTEKEASLTLNSQISLDKIKADELALLRIQKAEEEKQLAVKNTQRLEIETALNKELLIKNINDELNLKHEIALKEALAKQLESTKQAAIIATVRAAETIEANNNQLSPAEKATESITQEVKQPLTLSNEDVVSKEAESSAPVAATHVVSPIATTMTTPKISKPTSTEIVESTLPEDILQAEITKNEPENQKIAATTLQPLPQPREPITTKETMDALNSVMELIQQFEPKNELSRSQATTKMIEDTTGTTVELTIEPVLEKQTATNEAFVDASE